MTEGNGLNLDISTEENRAQRPAIRDDANTLIQVNKQYIPSDTLQLHSRPAPSHKRSFRTLVRGFHLSHSPALPRSNTAVDLLICIFCFFAVHYLYLGSLDLTSHRTIVLLSSLLLLVLALSAGGIYSTKSERTLNSELSLLTLCWVSAFAAIGLFAFLTKTAVEVSRVWISASMLFSLASLIGVRTLNALGLMAGNNAKSRNVIICGNSFCIKPVMLNIYSLVKSRVTVAKIFELSAQPSGVQDASNSLHIAAKQIVSFVETQRQSSAPIEQVWIAVSTNQSQIVKALSEALTDSSVDVCVIPDLYTERLLKGGVTRLGQTQVVNISEVSLSPGADQFKRVFDVFLASIALIVLIIPMVVIASLIKIESPGPALFRQRRYGIDGREIEILKFRSMKVHSDRQVRQATRNDVRITRIGNLLRSTSLDELPQLLNVLMGNMSLIGPRPHAVAHNEIWREQIKGYMLRHKVRPGITGWAQVNGWRGETDTPFKMQQRVKFDLEYIRNWSPWLDVKIILMTIVKGFRNENAY